MKKLLASALMAFIAFAPVADAKGFSGARSVAVRPTTIPRVTRPSIPQYVAPKPSYNAPYTTKKYYDNTSPTSSPWFWLWMMRDGDDDRTVVTTPSTSNADGNLSAWTVVAMIAAGVMAVLGFVFLLP